jgi:hypothetical protein
VNGPRPIASVLYQTLPNLFNEVLEEDEITINKAIVPHPIRVATHDGDCPFRLFKVRKNGT